LRHRLWRKGVALGSRISRVPKICRKVKGGKRVCYQAVLGTHAASSEMALVG
jgi:hypothetical protein